MLLVISAGLYFYSKQPVSLQSAKQKIVVENDIMPGGNRATLILSDGSKIVLDDTKKGVVAKQAGLKIQKTADGKVIYDLSKPGNPTSSIAYNIIETPRGGQYQINLPDGSKVWLNSASSLKFPVIFTGKNRIVELQGEAYFEIAGNKDMPFKVTVDTAEIEVLGTHFNVMAYAEEGSINTTLLEGSVRFSTGKESKRISPGQQLRLTKTMKIVEADLNEAIAWKNGYFIFKNEDISSIMRKISRWYDVEIEYQKTIPQKKFLGKISRAGNVSDVLEMLELTGAVRFNIVQGDSSKKGRRIIVMP